MKKSFHINSISEVHQMLGLDRPEHPLISVIEQFENVPKLEFSEFKITMDLFSVSLKTDDEGTLYYGRNTYDYQDGTLIFLKPNQVVEYEPGNEEVSHIRSWWLLFHPDLIRKSELAQRIDQYSFFDYDTREALHLSSKERDSIYEIIGKIKTELDHNIDRHSQELIVSNIKLLLDYCTRYFDRQFYTRTNLNKDLVTEFEQKLKDYYHSNKPAEKGIPTVTELGERMNMSPYYLSDLLKKETGRNTIEHIHFFIIEKAKNKLLGTTDSVSQIAYDLGFEYPQHFSKVFKNKTGMSPKEYRMVN